MSAPERGFEPIASAPLFPVALAATAGILVDRFWPMSPAFSAVLASAALVAWLTHRRDASRGEPFLLLAAAALFAAWHRLDQEPPSARGLRELAGKSPASVRLRGRLTGPPTTTPATDEVWLSIPRPETTRLEVAVSAVVVGEVETPLGGTVHAYVSGRVRDLTPGDGVELRGRLALPRGPSNPGEADRARDLRDDGVTAIVTTGADAENVVRRLERGASASPAVWLGRAHAWCKETVQTRMTSEPGLATALLLGDGSAMTRADWDKYIRTGVVHALAISGQHLAVLALFFHALRRRANLRLRHSSVAIALALLTYALLTGGRAPVMRAAWVMGAMSAGAMLGRPLLPRQALALGWLGVLIANPSDAFRIGCQLSFLAVLTLQAIVAPLIAPREEDPLDTLIRESRPWLVQRVLWFAMWAGRVYLANAIVWAMVSPLIAGRFHLVSFAALVIGPPVVALTSFALVSGLLLLLTSAWAGPLATPFAWLTDVCLGSCEWLVDTSLALPGACVWTAEVGPVWTAGFYLLALSTGWAWHATHRGRWPLSVAWGFWATLGVVWAAGVGRVPEARIAFLSVGHGGCVVFETAAGRVLVYDAGSLGGPEATRKVVGPYLWSRGIRRIDELFVSHADLDHFSGVAALAEQFALGRVSLTPSFADRRAESVRATLAALERRGVTTRVVKWGDAESVDELRWDTLHPPARGPEGKENARSLVLWLRWPGMSAVLTGDLEDAGREMVLAQRAPAIDVWLAPHHGGRTANGPEVASWAKPRVVVSSQGRTKGASPASVYEAVGATWLTTHDDGAIVVRRARDGWQIDTFRTQRAFALPAPAIGR